MSRIKRYLFDIPLCRNGMGKSQITRNLKEQTLKTRSPAPPVQCAKISIADNRPSEKGNHRN